MTPEQKRIAIAEACGWRGISEQFLVGYAPWRPEPYSDRVKSCSIADLDSIPLDPLPDYFNDLNVMHDAEKTMNNNDWWKFVEHLTNICGGGTALGISATAAQRAEAFLRILNLWVEELTL